MRALLLAAVVVGCHAGDFLVPDWGVVEGACPGPWTEQVLAPGVVAVTRDTCGFPDASLEYRIYDHGVRFAEGSMETKYWSRAVRNATELRLYDQRCTITPDVRCTPCGPDAWCTP